MPLKDLQTKGWLKIIFSGPLREKKNFPPDTCLVCYTGSTITKLHAILDTATRWKEIKFSVETVPTHSQCS